MKPLEEARSEVLSAVEPLGIEEVSIWEAGGRVLATDIIAPEDVPPFPNSALDGSAVRAGDVTRPGSVLEVIGELAAGSAPDVEVGPGEALKIMTGAPMPDGADTVVPVELTATEGSKVVIDVSVEAGASVRPAGGDVARGHFVVPAGTRLTPMHIGVLATIGVAAPMVSARPVVAFMSTGDELAPVETGTLVPGGIRDSNRPMLKALLLDAGADLVDLGIVPDDPDTLRRALQEGSRADVIASTGGVSMGDYDVTKLVLEGQSEVDFWKVAIQPAKPFAFGRVGDALFFGLPGNPVSVLISFEQFLRPALLRMQGARAILRPRLLAVAAEEIATDPEKTVFTRVVVEGLDGADVRVRTSGGQSSNVLSAAAVADAFAVIPVGVGTVPVGGQVTLELFKWPESREWPDGR